MLDPDRHAGRSVHAILGVVAGIIAGYVGMRLAMSLEYGGAATAHPWFIVVAMLGSSGGTFTVVFAILDCRAKQRWFDHQALMVAMGRRSRETEPHVADLREGRLVRLVCALFGGLITACVVLWCASCVRISDHRSGAGSWLVVYLAVGSTGGASSVLLWAMNRSAKQRWFDRQGLTRKALPRAQLMERAVDRGLAR